MPNDQDVSPWITQKYETVFCIFLALLAYLWRDNPNLTYPYILYLFAALLSLNLAAGIALRPHGIRPRPTTLMEWVSAAIILGNCAVITAILAYSGGPESNLWVLFLLPIYTTCILLDRRKVIWVTAGVLGFNAAFYGFSVPAWDAPILFEVAVKSGVFLFAAAATWNIAQHQKSAWAKVAAQRSVIDRLEGEAQAKAERLGRSEKAAELGWMMSGAAHDLSSPLTVILSSVQLLLDQPQFSGSPAHADLDRIVRAAGLCKTILSNLMKSSRMSDVEHGAEDMREVLESVLSLYEPALAQDGIRIRREYSGESFPIKANQQHLQRLFLNLLSNAKAAMKHGGDIRIATTAGPRYPEGPKEIRTVIEDTGPGIAEEMMPKLFKAFSTTKAPGEGTGLGLYLCREVAQQHGGSLYAENRPEGGARFVLILPAARSEMPAGMPA